jgi:membrane-associated phospholipid phosphatase
VAASWASVLALSRFHRKAAWIGGFFAAGMSLACVYTRYHHGVDVVAGVLMGIAGSGIGSWVSRGVSATAG